MSVSNDVEDGGGSSTKTEEVVQEVVTETETLRKYGDGKEKVVEKARRQRLRRRRGYRERRAAFEGGSRSEYGDRDGESDTEEVLPTSKTERKEPLRSFMSRASSDSTSPQELCNEECAGFTAVEKLGHGVFVEVWKGVQKQTGLEVAMKFNVAENEQRVLHEARMLLRLSEDSLRQGVVEHFDIVLKCGSSCCIIMEKLGHSLKDRLYSCGGDRVSLQTAALIAEQVVQRVEYVHSKGIVHRDIKPSNFIFGVGARVHHLYLTDFGSAKSYWVMDRMDDRWKHIPKKVGCKIGGEKVGCQVGGATRYWSANAHKGMEQGRRDDLESTAYLFLYLIKGKLPWWSCTLSDDEVGHMKQLQTTRSICKGAPLVMERYLDYCRGLGFAAKPSYSQLYNMVHSLRSPQIKDHEYQWFENGIDGGFHPEELEPLQPYSTVAQPDEHVSSAFALRHVLKSSQKWSSGISMSDFFVGLFRRKKSKNSTSTKVTPMDVIMPAGPGTRAFLDLTVAAT